MKHTSTAIAALFVTAGMLSGCTMKSQDAPDLSGPSEFATAISVSLSPDVLTQDGASQSVVTVTARDSNAQPVRSLPLRAEIRVGGTIADFGSLSARSIVTGADGRATFVYTAPPAASMAVDTLTVVDIAVIPIGSDFLNSMTRIASVRLVPPGIVIPPDGLRPAFTVNPTDPQDNQSVLFDASTSQAPGNNPIVSFAWNFGDGDSASGRTVSHQYRAPGTYIVSLTVSDTYGRTATATQSLTVGPGLNPTAAFTFSPTDALPGTRVFFNAASSRAAPGRTIVRYQWDFGDGGSASGSTASRVYPTVGTYTVTLTVTDDAGRRGVTSSSVQIALPEEEEELMAPGVLKGGTLRD
ncbi:MAG TPA: PKD domain-containing protein [Vicinamibacterales bacterium]|jgi:PKD repeat protein|nr:PKD domain-containing protein [Vicinamibacterales bacterium]